MFKMLIQTRRNNLILNDLNYPSKPLQVAKVAYIYKPLYIK
jgi:hypothetical protein